MGNLNCAQYINFWNKFDSHVDNEKIISVREAYQEIKNGGDNLAEWAEKNKKSFFHIPEQEELIFVQKIFQNKHYQKLIKIRNIASGTPVADPFLIAKAKVIQGCLITEDGFFRDGRLKLGSPSPAFICKELGIECLNLTNFMKKERWSF